MSSLILGLSIVICAVFSPAISKDGSYTAAVVDYIPVVNGNSTSGIVISNIGQYISYIEKAAKKHSDIIVFPQDGLTGWKLDDLEEIRKIAAEIPNPDDLVVPCNDNKKPHSMVIVAISCAAKIHGIYTVVNIIEKEHNKDTGKDAYYNTDVVFDRNGIITAKSRNVNMGNNVPLTKHKLETFDTDFGAKFGLLSPFDIISANPAVNTLSDVAVTDIVYPNSWKSELPFYAAGSVNHGYAVVNEVNLLSAALKTGKGSSGTGIFLANGDEAEIFNPEQPNLITHEVPLLQLKSYSGLCKKSESSKEPEEIGFNLIDEFPDDDNKINEEDLSLYNFKAVDLQKEKNTEKVCSGENDEFCCLFDITIDRNSSHHRPNYTYMMVSHERIQNVFGMTIKISNCAILACLNQSITSCGKVSMEPKAGTTFEKLIIDSTLTTKNSLNQPSVLNFDLTTFANYSYCQQQVNETVSHVHMSTDTPSEGLLTFGIISRSYVIGSSGKTIYTIGKVMFVLNMLCFVF